MRDVYLSFAMPCYADAMDMSFSPRNWPQLRREPRDGTDSIGPEWRTLLTRLDTAQAARLAMDGTGEISPKGSFSPVSAHSLEGLVPASTEGGSEKDNRAVNHGDSGNCKPVSPQGIEEVGDAFTRPRED